MKSLLDTGLRPVSPEGQRAFGPGFETSRETHAVRALEVIWRHLQTGRAPEPSPPRAALRHTFRRGLAGMDQADGQAPGGPDRGSHDARVFRPRALRDPSVRMHPAALCPPDPKARSPVPDAE